MKRRLAQMGPLERPGRLGELADELEELALPERARRRAALEARVAACRAVGAAAGGAGGARRGVPGGGMATLEAELRGMISRP